MGPFTGDAILFRWRPKWRVMACRWRDDTWHWVKRQGVMVMSICPRFRIDRIGQFNKPACSVVSWLVSYWSVVSKDMRVVVGPVLRHYRQLIDVQCERAVSIISFTLYNYHGASTLDVTWRQHWHCVTVTLHGYFTNVSSTCTRSILITRPFPHREPHYVLSLVCPSVCLSQPPALN